MIARLTPGLVAAGLIALPFAAPAQDSAGSGIHKSLTHDAVVTGYTLYGKGPLVVLLPSVGRGAAELAPVAEQLARRGYTTALPEPRGIGASRGPMQGISLHDYARDVAAVIRAEGGSAVVAGHAYGNWVARTVASDDPGMVRGVVIIAGGAKAWPHALLDDIRTLNDPATGTEARMRALHRAFFTPDEDATPWLEGWHGDVSRAQLAAVEATPRSTWWSAGDAPILDLIAAEDPFRPAASRDETRAELGARVSVQIVAQASHALPAARPVETANRIADWIATLPAR